MRSALCNDVGGVPEGTLRVGAVPAVPAGERSPVGIVAMVPFPGVAVEVPPEATVVVVVEGPLPVLCDVPAAPDEFNGDELQAARPSAPAAPMTTASIQERSGGRDMARDGSRSHWPSIRTPRRDPSCRGCGVARVWRWRGGPDPAMARGSINEFVDGFERSHRPRRAPYRPQSGPDRGQIGPRPVKAADTTECSRYEPPAWVT